MKETGKARPRREAEGFYEKYCNGKGIDIGCFDEPLLPTCDHWDLQIDTKMDAKFMSGVDDEIYDFVYSSHCLEDIDDPSIALKNWYRILKRGGYLILFLPHRDLFEHVRTLPSPCNSDHKHYFLIDKDEQPDTLGVIPLISNNLTDYDLLYVKKCEEGHKHTYIERDNGYFSIISEGEYSIEVVLKKGNDAVYYN